MLHAYFPDIPVYVDKNINCYTLAELWLGEGKQSNNFATVSVGAGLGLSVVINRQIYYGAQVEPVNLDIQRFNRADTNVTVVKKDA